MRKEEFRTWLDLIGVKRRPANDCVSRCLRVEKALNVDLDEEYKKDEGVSVVLSLQYTAEDERNGAALPVEFNFQKPSTCRFGMSALRSAVKKYLRFCEE